MTAEEVARYLKFGTRTVVETNGNRVGQHVGDPPQIPKHRASELCFVHR